MTNIAIIFAGGSGQRMRRTESSLPKQFLEINGKPIIVYTLELFQKHPEIDKVYIAINPKYMDLMKDLVKHYYLDKVCGITNGGDTGQDSIYKVLKLAQSENSDDSIVLIHDGVRPNITPEVISKNIECAKANGNAITCTNCYETILISENHINPKHVPARKNTYAAQAPQTFHLGEVVAAHEFIRPINPEYTDIVDTCTLFRVLGKETFMVEGNRGNLKVTTIEDLYILRAYIHMKEDAAAYGLK